ncbi:hypothetical protein JF50_08520 [Pseudoalteromonas luteoviolacea]|uniref:Gfo/Idh/MocA-like oxidoreductase N-terminal domain-containing protein n=1 Tax=Pseudoalteromonas luteoviolacea TaxID=43657 RepID=A0A0C1MRI0_9GAMM|nr:Gfo/Idh/MocA family oxidoreductase [Pseudoalteromonas luteoviolacea]KID57263.1 hypothetical protein JF50_08520 [Pseudoalteromonas luteoviolacea]
MIKTILCGTNYGSVYLRSLLINESFSVNALFSRGGERSLDIAKRLNVTNYNTLDEVPDTFELAIVALPKEVALQTARHFLQRKTAVLLEHPIDLKDFKKLQTLAQQYNTKLFINSHFLYMENIADFIKRSKQLPQKELIGVSVNCYARTLYSTLDILYEYLGEPCVDTIQSIECPDYKIAIIQFKYINVSMKIFKSIGEKDDIKDSIVGHNIINYYGSTSLSLTGSWGTTVTSKLPEPNSLSNIQKFSDTSIDMNKLLSFRENAIGHVLSSVERALLFNHSPTEFCLNRALSIVTLYDILKEA